MEKNRINAQISLEEKVKKATAVIDNNGTLPNTKFQVINLITKYELTKYSFFSIRNIVLLSLLSISIYLIYGNSIKSFLFRR